MSDTPRHIAIIMDGNGRWAKRRFMPRFYGHKRGLSALRTVVKACCEQGVEFLTVFAFSSENWRRPTEEVSFLMKLFADALDKEVARLHDEEIRLRIAGNMSRFHPMLVEKIQAAERLTAANQRMTLSLAVDYGGRWDILQAAQKAQEKGLSLTEENLSSQLSLAYAPDPELLIRTSGEQRVSNFMLWQLAYSELYFTDTLWPDFDAAHLNEAISWYQQRDRRFGGASE